MDEKEAGPGTIERMPVPVQHHQGSAFHSIQAFEQAQRMARALASSDLVPQQFRNNLANCVIALEMSQRIGASPLAVMQNLNIIHGRPSWGAQFVIAALNSCGLFSPLRFKVEGAAAQMRCTAYAVELTTGETLHGPAVSMEMAEREGWLRDKPTRDGGAMVSKWKTMPDVMIRYRAATYFGRLYAPHILMGMRPTDEIIDTIDAPVDNGGTVADEPKNKVADLNAQIAEGGKAKRGKAKQEPEPPAPPEGRRVVEGEVPPEPQPPQQSAPAPSASGDGFVF